MYGWVGEDARPALSINLRLQIFQSSEMLTPHQAGVVLPVNGVMVRCGDAGSDIILLCHQRNVPCPQARLVTHDRVRAGQVIWTKG